MRRNSIYFPAKAYLMITPDYSKAVLEGMRQRGVSLDDMAFITGLPTSGLKLILKEKASLKYRHLELIERATGLTAGQLAALSLGEDAKPLQDLMDMWARVKVPMKLNGRNKATKPRRKTRAVS